jgi:hypothetical protein
VLLVLGLIGAALLVVYPLAYRISSENTVAIVVATAGPVPSAEPITPSPTASFARRSPDPTPAGTTVEAIDPALSGGWLSTAEVHRGANGDEFRYSCSPDGVFGSIWGSGPYTDDSSVCTAGVHAGVITRARGGVVTIVIRPGRASYEGTRRHGVTTEPYEAWDGSYVVVR